MLICVAGALLIVLPVDAQREPDPTPIPYTPGVPLFGLTETPIPGGCFDPLGLAIGQTVLVKVGVELRNLPTISGGIVWNTVFDFRVDPDGDDGEFDFELSEDARPLEAIVVEGPVCADGLNWWRIEGLGNPGWVAEGTPDFYNIFGAPTGLDNCDPLYPLQIGQSPEVLYNVRIRTQPNRISATRTVVSAGAHMVIVDGPSCDGEYLWWLVQTTVNGLLYEGWVREGEAGESFT